MNKFLSVTQLKMYLRCPLQYKFRYVDGIKIPPVSNLTLGKAIHSALEVNYTQKITSQTDLPLDAIKSAFSDCWDRDEKETVFDSDEKPGNIKDEGIGLLSAYHDKVSPTITPKIVERDFELTFENVVYTLKGKLDLVDVYNIIIDHKTSKRSMSEDVAGTDIQLTCYALAYRHVFGIMEKSLRFDVMVRTKTPKIQQLPTQRTQKDIDRFLKVLAYVCKAIETGIFYPNTGFACSNCGYGELCGRW